MRMPVDALSLLTVKLSLGLRTSSLLEKLDLTLVRLVLFAERRGKIKHSDVFTTFTWP